MTFNAGQRVLASTLNSNMPQLLGSVILSLSAASITITIPAGFNHLQCAYTAREDAAGSGGDWVLARFNGDSGSNYTWQTAFGNQTTASAANAAGAVSSIRVGAIPKAGDTATYVGAGSFVVGNCSSTAVFKALAATFQGSVSSTNAFAGTGGGVWLSTAAVTSLTLLPANGNLVAGSSLSVYGWD